MSEMDKAMFWASAWSQLFLFRWVTCARVWKRATWAKHRLDMARRAEEQHDGGPKCSFCEVAGHDESQVACQERRQSAASYAYIGSKRYPRPKGCAE